MRILHAYNQHRGGGGSENAARATIEIARQHGCEVEIFTRDSEDLVGLAGRIQAATSAFYAPKSVSQFRAHLETFRPDLVHIHEVFPLVSPWILPECARHNVPVVMTCVDYRLTCPVVTHLRAGRVCSDCVGGHEYRALLHNCRRNLAESLTVAAYSTMTRKLGLFHKYVSYFIAPSEFSLRWHVDKGGIRPDRIGKVSPLVEIPDTAADSGAGMYAGFAGRFTPEKGVETFLQASRLTEAPLRLCRNFRALVTVDIPKEADVLLTHGKEDLAHFYRSARMIVFPSIWFESFGLVPAEAMSHGIPVVASRLGAAAEMVEDGVDGVLFDAGSPSDLAEKVSRLWADPELCRTMGRAAREKAISKWRPERHWESLLAIYEKVCSRKPSHSVARA